MNGEPIADATPYWGWIVEGSKGWMRLVEQLATRPEPIPPGRLDELVGVHERLGAVVERLMAAEQR